jgi:TatD DNase family protein
MFTDTHCHLNLEQFAGDRDEVIQRAIDSGVERMLVPGMDLNTCHWALMVANNHPAVYAATGFHPTQIEHMDYESYLELSILVSGPKVVAIGEIGLDYYWVKEPDKRETQRKYLVPQLQLAQKENKPVILHLREENDAESGEATNDLFAILEEWQEELVRLDHPLAEKPGVFHSFNGNLRSAQRAIKMNFFIGITGSVTHKKNDTQRELVRQLPLDRILIETDSPFQTPHPHRGERNEPSYVTLVADRIAEVHQTTRETIAEITTANANRLFGWEANA